MKLYIINCVLPLIITFVLTAVLGPVLIPFLHRLKFGQTEREEGPQSHKVKAGTPTMGGIMFLLPMLIVGLCLSPYHPSILPVLFLTIGFGVIGFLDDYIKVVLKRNLGLTPIQKLALQFIVTGVFAYWIIEKTGISLAMRVPFWKGGMIDLGILNLPLMFFVILGTVNGTNFTDGLDGLASSVTCVVAGFFTFAAFLFGTDLSIVSSAMLGGLLGFLLYNVYPAKIFMGDTGSLALGGFVAGMAYMMNMPLFIIPVGIIYLAEVISVILQVGYFKLTHGKRIFRMAPIHHHYELGGWSETRIVAVFSIVTFICCLLAFCGLV